MNKLDKLNDLIVSGDKDVACKLAYEWVQNKSLTLSEFIGFCSLVYTDAWQAGIRYEREEG